MKANYPSLNEEEQLKADNDFLKMKLMLEHGAEFMTSSSTGIAPAMENTFLRNIIAYEEHSAKYGEIAVYEKLGRPVHFRPVSTIDDGDISDAWAELYTYMLEHGISLNACSPRITDRQLYRFATEELFFLNIMSMSAPGMIHGFIYDEFYPDPIYDNTCVAVNECLQQILNERPLEWMNHFSETGLRLNHHYPLDRQQFKDLVNQFKWAYDGVRTIDITDVNCEISEGICKVNGKYLLEMKLDHEVMEFAGEWLIQMEKAEKNWHIIQVWVEGIRF